MTRRNRQKGATLAELIILAPVLMITMLGSIDLGRLVFARQVMSDLSREAANLVSRGASIDQAVAAVLAAEQSFSIDEDGGIIISRIERRNSTSSTPWVISQTRRGFLSTYSSHIGASNSAASIPNIDSLPPGVAITTVEIVHPFSPVFPLASLGLDIYPELIYDIALF